jgi:hypothetical protein
MPETFTLDRVDRLTDVLYGVAAAGGLIGMIRWATASDWPRIT